MSHALLLLPGPPEPLTEVTLEAALSLPLTAVLEKLPKTPSRLDVAVRPRDLDLLHRSISLDNLSLLLIGLYGLVSRIQNELFQREDLVDVRVILLGEQQAVDFENYDKGTLFAYLDVIVNIELLALSRRVWTQLFVVESEAGEAMLREMHEPLTRRQGEPEMLALTTNPIRVAGGLVLLYKHSHQNVSARYPAAFEYLVIVTAKSQLTADVKTLLTCAMFLANTKRLEQLRKVKIVNIVPNDGATSRLDLSEIASFLAIISDFRRPRSKKQDSPTLERSEEVRQVLEMEQFSATAARYMHRRFPPDKSVVVHLDSESFGLHESLPAVSLRTVMEKEVKPVDEDVRAGAERFLEHVASC